MLAQHLHQLRRDALRQEGRNAGADAQELDVGDGPQAAKELIEGVIGHQQRIAAREQHVAHLGVLPEIGEGGLDAVAQRLQLALAHQPAAGAVAAVGGAGVQHEQEDAVRIAMDEPLDDGRVVLAAGVGHVAGADQQLVLLGHDLEADGTAGIFGIDQRRPLGVTATENFSLASIRPRRSDSVR